MSSGGRNTDLKRRLWVDTGRSVSPRKNNPRRKRKRVVMARLVKLEKADRSFDLGFWERVGAEGRFEALWAMVREALMLRGVDADPPRLQRSVERVQWR